MSVKVDGSQATVHWLSNSNNQFLTKDQGVLYVTRDGKLGQLTAESYAGLTPQKAFENSYSSGKRQMLSDWIADDFIVFDKKSTTDADPDDGVRSLIVSLFKKNKISFSANIGAIQKENTNSESLISYARATHLNDLKSVIKQYFGLSKTFDTRTSISWRFKQLDDIHDIEQILITYKLCLFAAYTSRGKTKIGIGVAVRLLQNGGIVLVTTPISDTKKSFEENIQNYHFGNDRNLKVTYMDSVAFSKCTVEELVARKQNGELIFIVLTVQDLRYGESENTQIDSSVKKLRNKYHALSGKVDLWIRDERHAQYGGEVTSQRLADMIATYELDLTATPYNVLDKYNWEQIVSRTLLWGLKHQTDTKLPTIRIDAISTPISSISPKLASVYSEEEGFDPRKLFVRSNNNFVLEAELLAIRDSMYHNTLSKRKNPLSIINDTELSSVAKNCGMWVLPEGQDGDGAAEYIPDVATLLNGNSSVYFTDSYTIEKECPKNSTIGDYIELLIEKHSRVVILTCGKFLTGTDIPALGHIVLLSKMNNIANFEQLMGRMIREYPGKNDVKMYCFAPAMEIGLVMGKMAKMNVALSGGSEYDLLDCVPLTEYVNNVATKISPDHILAEVQEHFKQISKDRLPSASLETALSSLNIDLSAWYNVDTKKFKKSAPKASVTEHNGSKVKIKVSIDPITNKPRTKDEINKLEQIANVIQTIMVEAKWVAYSIDNYNYFDVLRNIALEKMFPDEIEMVIETIESCNTIKEMVIKNFNDKKIAYTGLDPKNVYDDIFMNNKYKQSIGLVYVNFALAKEMVDNLPNKYNRKDATILVINALSGTFPILLRERFPKARIICAEYVDYFTDHLTRLGFEVTKIIEKEGELVLDKKYDGIKADVVIGNPPYQGNNDTSRTDNNHRGQGDNLAKKFALKMISLCNKNMIIIMPYGHRTYSSNVKKTYMKNGLYKIVPVIKHFSTVTTNPCAFMFDKSNIVETVDDQYNVHKITLEKNNIGKIFRNQPGHLNRKDYEHLLQEKGKYRVVVTTNIVRYTDDIKIVTGMNDKTTGNWRVVFNCTTSIGKLGKVIVESPESILSKSVHCLILPDEKSANNMKRYLESDAVKKILKEVKVINACNSKKFLEYIPMPGA